VHRIIATIPKIQWHWTVARSVLAEQSCCLPTTALEYRPIVHTIPADSCPQASWPTIADVVIFIRRVGIILAGVDPELCRQAEDLVRVMHGDTGRLPAAHAAVDTVSTHKPSPRISFYRNVPGLL